MTSPAAATPTNTEAHERGAPCIHCALPIPTGSGDRFCCTGCETAYELIHSCGLDAYYRLREQAEQSPSEPSRKARSRGYADFDDRAFQSLYCTTLEDGTVQTELLLEGLHCAACVWLVEKLPRIVPGVIEARLDMRRACVAVRFDPARTTLGTIGRTLDSLGYPPHPARQASVREARRREDRRMLVRVAVAGACAGNIMLLFFALYAGMFEGIEREHEQLFRWTAMLLNTLCLAWPGLVFARSAIAALRARTINLDVPIAMGLYLGGAWGIWKTIAGSGDLYFDSISALVFFLLIGRMIQLRQQRYAADSLELLFNLRPATARRVHEDGSITEIATEGLNAGDIVEVRAGETVPSDGTILLGSSRFDQSMLTGESRPVALCVGDEAASGTLNVSSPIRMLVSATGESTRIGRLMRTVEEAGRRRAAIVRLADRWGARLLWALLALAAATLLLWWKESPSIAIDRAAALLIATCPCGLGLATPLAMTVAMGWAARRGMLVKGGDVFEALATGKGIVLIDKTGTITRGEMSLVRWYGDESVRGAVGALEQGSSHPIARTLASACCGGFSPAFSAGESVETPGRGIVGRGEIHGSGFHRIAVGSERFLEDLGAEIAGGFRAIAAGCAARGNTAVMVALDNRCVALAEIGDPVRSDSASSIVRMRALGWNVRMLSGDREDVARAVGGVVGLHGAQVIGGATPEEKVRAVRSAAEHATVVMIGDGVNDAAALASATVGIAVRGGAEASLAAADVSLQKDGLGPVVELMEASRRVVRSIHLTIAASLGYNVLAAGLAMTGMISPLLAAIIMPASSLTVVAICLRSKPFKQNERAAPAERKRARREFVPAKGVPA
ncbi:MAG: heavy metal translocating P-type ATPase [Planctomycetes bacterium]|nr:heavy metal translocating P-type ATPase [Planctomycetota bacterium]